MLFRISDGKKIFSLQTLSFYLQRVDPHLYVASYKKMSHIIYPGPFLTITIPKVFPKATINFS